MISSIFAHNSKSIEANQAPHVGGASVSGVEVEEGDDVSDDGSDTDTVDEDVAAKEVIAIQAFDPNRREPEVEDVTGDPSLRQYQRTFDDSLVDYELMYQLLIYVFKSDLCKDGCVLVFLPGWDDISNMSRMLRFSHEFGNTARFKILQLHSTIPRKDQAEAFLPAGKGVRKIILSTNIAETSITIDDVSVVIDTGKVKEISYDPHVKLAYLKTTYVSKASARQRRGRAGRTRAGACFHMFSKTRHSSLAEFQDSELLRMPLEELVLQTKMLGLAVGKGSVEEFLGKAMDPPHELSIVNALDVLRSIQCLNENEELTVIGQAVGKLPIEPKSAYTILLGSLMGLGDEAVKAIAAMSRDPFVPPVDDKMRAAFNKSKAKLGLAMPSDQFSLLKALDGYLVKSKTSNNASLTEYCERNFLSRTALTYLADVSQQMNSVLDSIGMNLSHPRSMRNSGNTYLLISVLSIGLYPSIGVRRHGATLFTTEKGPKAKIHPSSVNYSHSQYKKPCAVDVDIVGFDSLISTKPSERNPNSASLMMLSTTPLSVLAVILACAEMQIVDNSIDETSVLLIVDDWLKLRGDRDVAKVLQAMRECLVEALVRFVRDPARPLPLNIGNALEAVCSALTIEQQDVYPRQGPVEH
jgi:HrpA-like RNA helicase